MKISEIRQLQAVLFTISFIAMQNIKMLYETRTFICVDVIILQGNT